MRYVAFSFALLLPLCALAQVSGSISGSVADQSGSAVVGAAVKLISETTGAVRAETTNAEGNFTFTAVAPGTYTVRVEHAGFKKFQKEHFELTPGDTRT